MLLLAVLVLLCLALQRLRVFGASCIGNVSHGQHRKQSQQRNNAIKLDLEMILSWAMRGCEPLMQAVETTCTAEVGAQIARFPNVAVILFFIFDSPVQFQKRQKNARLRRPKIAVVQEVKEY